MAQDLYRELGVSRSASEDEIRKAYRKLAAELHPDRNQDKPDIEARFKRVNSAYHTLSDAKKRKLYDQYGEAGLREGFDPRAGGFGRAPAGNARGAGFEDIFSGGGQGGIGDLFGDLFSGAGRARRRGPQRSPDQASVVTIEFSSAVRGAELELAVAERTVKVRIPKGADNGDKLRVKGGSADGAGDLILSLKVKPHPHFERKGLDLHLEVPLSVGEAYAGCKVEVPTLDSSVQLSVKEGTQSGQTVRLRGKGITRGERTGDLYVRYLVKLPQARSQKLERAAQELSEATTEDLRGHLQL